LVCILIPNLEVNKKY